MYFNCTEQTQGLVFFPNCHETENEWIFYSLDTTFTLNSIFYLLLRLVYYLNNIKNCENVFASLWYYLGLLFF